MRQGGGQQSPIYDELIKAEEAAKAAHKGLWTTDVHAVESAVRIPPSDALDASALLARHGKGKPLPAIVEQVISGSLVRVTLPEDGMAQILIFVCGVQAPSMGRKAPAAATNSENNAGGENGAPPPSGGFSAALSAGISTSGGVVIY